MNNNKTITANFSPSPAHDDFANARLIDRITYEDLDVDVTGATTQIGVDPDNIGPCDTNQYYNIGNKTVWYVYTNNTNPPTSQSLAIDTKGSAPVEYDTLLSVWKETSGGLSLVTCNDDNGQGYSEVTFIAEPGSTYYIQVAEFNGIEGGTLGGNVGGTLQFHAYIRNIEVRLGSLLLGTYFVPSGDEKRVYYNESGGPLKVKSLDSLTNIVSAIRLQSYANNTLYSFVETMGVPQGLLSYKYVFPTYNNTWAPLNSQLRFANLETTPTTIRVTIGGTVVWEQSVPGQEERRLYFNVSGGPVVVESLDTNKKIIAAIRLQSYGNNTLYSFSETMGIPAEQLSYRYYFPTYNNTWAPLNSQLRFGNLETTPTTIRVTIGGTVVWEQSVPGLEERRLYFNVSGGPVVVESLDTNKKIVAAIRLQSYANGTLYSFVETMGVPQGLLSHKYYFPTYNNTWAPLNSQVRFANLETTPTTIRVTIGGTVVWEQSVPGQEERRLYFNVSGGPVIIESLDTNKKIIAAIRLQSYANNTLYSFAETMGIPAEQLSSVYYFPTYNNTWAPLNSQLRFGVP
jgi:predicted small integral membrane protein